MSNAFFASGIIPIDYQPVLARGPSRRMGTPMERPPTMVAKEIRHVAGATPQINCNKKLVKEIRLKARSRVYGSEGRRPARKGLVRENSITMLVNAKTKL